MEKKRKKKRMGVLEEKKESVREDLREMKREKLLV